MRVPTSAIAFLLFNPFCSFCPARSTAFLSPAGYVVRLLYSRNSYDEAQFDFDDFESNIVTISVGYRF